MRARARSSASWPSSLCSSGSHWVLHRTPRTRASLPELQVLVGRRVRVIRDQPEARLLDARPDRVQEAELPQGRVHHPLVRELLELVEERLPALRIQLAGLLRGEIFHVGMAAPRVRAVLREVVLDTGGGVAEATGA